MQISEPAVPTLLYLLCAMSAMAFLMSAYLWQWRALYSKNELDFKPSIYRGQVYSLLGVMVLSIILGSYDYFFFVRELHIGAEALILVSALAYAYIKAGVGKRFGVVLGSIIKVSAFGFSCILGWLITLAIGVTLIYLFGILGIPLAGNIDPNIVFITGLLWNVPILLLYIKLLKNPDKTEVVKFSGFHKFLWPVLMAYIVLLFPLLIQEISVSEKWREMKNEKPLRTV